LDAVEEPMIIEQTIEDGKLEFDLPHWFNTRPGSP
jgi:hypothetical protein